MNSPSGTFKISDQGVVGQGAYSISNTLAEIGLKLVIPISTPSKDKATATITSLPPKRVGFPGPSSVSGVSGMSGATSPSSPSGLPGATGPAAAGSAPAPSSPSGPVGANGAGISSQPQSGVTLTPAGW